MRIPDRQEIGRLGTRSGRIAPSGPNGAIVGQAVANLGGALQQAAYNINDLRVAEQQDQLRKRGNDVANDLTRFLADEEQRLLTAQDEADESGIGFTRSFMEEHQKRANAFAKSSFEGLTDDDNARYNNTILARGNALYQKAYDFEGKAKSAYYDRVTGQGLDTYRTQIRNNAASFDDLKAEGLRQIDSADMPEWWKAERREAWGRDAAESRWQWEFERDPETAVADIRGTTAVKPAKLSGSVSQRGAAALDYYQKQGYSLEQAAGIVGNLIQESGLDPNVAPGDNGTAFGLAQWRGERFNRLKRFAASRGKPWQDFETQLAFVDAELQTHETAAYQRLKNAKTVDEATAAFIGYERPKGWTVDNPRGGHGYRNRLANAAGLLGQDVETGRTPSAELSNIPYERRQQLADWGTAQIDRQRRKAEDEQAALYTQARDAMDLGIETGRITSETEILNSSLDDGDKATLLRRYRTKQEETALIDTAAASFAAGSLQVDPYDTDARKAVDGLYGRLMDNVAPEQMQAVTEDLVRQGGVVPKQALNLIRRGLESRDVDAVMHAAQAANRLAVADPAALGRREGGAAVQEMADDFRHYVNDLNLSPEDAAQRLIDLNNPETKSDRKALEPAAKAFLKTLDDFNLAGAFDESFMGWRGNADLGFDTAAELGIQAEFAAIAEDQFYRANGDPEIAKNRAVQEMKRLYGVTSVTGRPVVMKHPPERHWPAFNWSEYGETLAPSKDKSLDYARHQLRRDMQELFPGVDMDRVQLVTTPETDRMVKAGEMPGYAVMYRDENGVMQTIPGKLWRPDTTEFKARQDAVDAREKAETERRARAAQEAEAIKAREIMEGRDRERSLDIYLDGNPLTGTK